MNVPCDLCGERDGHHRGGATFTCNECQAARRRLDECDPAGIARPTEEALRHAEQLLERALPFTP